MRIKDFYTETWVLSETSCQKRKTTYDDYKNYLKNNALIFYLNFNNQ